METIKNKYGNSYKETVRINGQKLSKCFKRKTDAQTWKQEILSERRKGNFLNLIEDKKISFREVASLWLEQKANTKAYKTHREYRSICEAHFNPKFGHLPIANISINHIDAVVDDLVKRKRSPKTINKVTNAFKQIMRFAVRRRILRQFPFDQIENLPEPERPIVFFTEEEIRKILDSSEGTQLYSVLVIALNTGMRIGEIFGLKWDNINFNKQIITCSRKMNRSKLEEYTKTKKVRHIGINPQLLQELQNLKRKNPFSEFVISNDDGTPVNPDHYCARVYKRHLLKIGVRQLRFHDLRHSFASHFMMNGGNIFELQKILGHSKIEMTEKYAHLSGQHLVKAASTVGFSSVSMGKLLELSQNCPIEKNLTAN